MAKLFLLIDWDDVAVVTSTDREKYEMSFHWVTDLAVGKVARFGTDPNVGWIYETYKKRMGGLQNRELGELVDELLKIAEEEHRTVIPLREELITNISTVREKYYIDQISDEWPAFHDGFPHFYTKLVENSDKIDAAFITSNHKKIVESVMRKRGLPVPNNIISGDELRNFDYLDRLLQKPSPFSIWLAENKRLGRKSIVTDPSEIEDRNIGKPYMAVIGNHPEIDGEMARRAGVAFLFYPSTHPDFMPDPKQQQILLPRDFSLAIDPILTCAEAVKAGFSASEWFFRRDAELASYMQNDTHEMFNQREKPPHFKERW